MLQDKIMTDMKIVNTANKLKRELVNRENELLGELDILSIQNHEELRCNLKAINKTIEKEQNFYEEFKKSIKEETNPLYRLRKVFGMTRPSLRLGEIDQTLKSKTEINLPDDLILKLLIEHIRPSISNIKEYKISRSRMPWAIK